MKMSKKEAIQAMLDGKKVRQGHWPIKAHFIFMNLQGKFVGAQDDALVDLNVIGNEPWEIYEEPRSKQTFYRRKWIMDRLKNAVFTSVEFRSSKEEFDNFWGMHGQSGYTGSEEWEEIEI